MGPPKCKTCGITEWRHVCGPKVTIEEITRTIESTAHFKAMKAKIENPQITPLGKALSKPKTDRKAYLAQKAKERRARQKAAKT